MDGLKRDFVNTMKGVPKKEKSMLHMQIFTTVPLRFTQELIYILLADTSSLQSVMPKNLPYF
jgi:hypothetical protein